MEASLIGKALNFGFNDYGFDSHASKLNFNYWLPYIINQINLNSAKKNLKFCVTFNKTNMTLLKILNKFGVILSYSLIKEKNFFKIIVYIYYFKNILFFKNFQQISTSSKSFFISSRMLFLLNKRTANSIFLLSTNNGIISHNEALKKNIGGKLLLLLL